MSQSMFSSEVELGSFLGSIDVIPDAFRAISDTSLSYQLQKSPSGFQILAFNCSPDYTPGFLHGEFDLVSSENVRVVDFIPTKVNPLVFINKAAVSLFEHLSKGLKKLENQLIYKPLVVTGQGVGGYVAILFSLWLQHAIDVKEGDESEGTKRPICITFGSPLVGDDALQRAIAERPQWKSSFLNVVAKTDHVASHFNSSSQHKPFGTFLFCTESGGHAAFEDQESVLAVLDTVSSRAGDMGMPDYGHDLQSIRRKALLRGVSELGESHSNPLREGIRWQMREVGLLDDISNDLIGRMEAKQAKIIKSKKHVYEPNRKLNEIKKSMMIMERYMKTSRSKGGYYDLYKKTALTREETEIKLIIVKNERILNQYWGEIVKDKDQMPQKEGAKLRKAWLYSGNNCRRIIEPLGIAYYYHVEKKKDYMSNRPNHYKLLEKWWNEDKKDLNPSVRKKRAASLTEDSCFWAHVEDALIWVRDLKNGSNIVGDMKQKQKMEQDLKEFESYVMCAINSWSVSSDIFLEGSSLMKWWSEYKVY